MKNWTGGTRVEKIKANLIRIDQRELAARLGGSTEEMQRTIYNSVLDNISASYSVTLVPVGEADGVVTLCGKEIKSLDLSKVLSGCKRVVLLVATLGFALDRYIFSLGVRSASMQFLADALSDALVEGVCDMAEADVGESLKLGNRFSPGYGDLPLSVGRDIVSNTRSDILLGIRFTDSGLALPKKTVTAIIPVFN